LALIEWMRSWNLNHARKIKFYGFEVCHSVGPAHDGSLDRVLAEAGIPMFLLDLTSVPSDGPVADWLAAKPPTRWIGSVFSQARAQHYVHAADPRRESDLLAFVERTTAARPNPLGRRPVWSRQELVAERPPICSSRAAACCPIFGPPLGTGGRTG